MVDIETGGFSFDLCKRNNMLQKAGMKFPKMTKTGTTIVGIIFKDGVVLGADTRATEGPIVADKNSEKIHYIAKNIYCCGSGTSADTDNVSSLISSQVELQRLSTGREVRIDAALNMIKQRLFQYQGHISSALILGGVDINGPQICCIHPHGSAYKTPFSTMGSGSLAAMGILENKYLKDMSRKDAIDLVSEAVLAGIFNDLGSGSNVNIVVIEKGKVEILNEHIKPSDRKIVPMLNSYKFSKGTTQVIKESVRPLHELAEVESEEHIRRGEMEVD